MYNPSLRQEPRHEPAAVIPIKQEASILDWLEANGRLLARDEVVDPSYLDDGEEITDELLGADDNSFDDLDDDDLDDDVLED
jgi:hypothetical protein